MEIPLLKFFVLNDALHSTCDFNLMFAENDVSIYEVVRVEDGIPLFLDAHLRRLYDSARFEGKEIEITTTEIRRRLKILITQNRMVFGNIKFVYRWSASGDRQFYAWASPFFYPGKQQYKEGVHAETLFAERPNPNAKKVLTALRERADSQIEKHRCYEVVYVNSKNEITEGSRSNIFFVQNQHLVTSELSSVLPGVTRAVIIDLAKHHGIPVVEKKIPLSDLGKFSSCFLSGTSPKILPVSRLNAKTFDVNDHRVRFLMDIYDDLCKAEKENFQW